MRAALAGFASIVMIALIGVSIWATGHQSIVPAIQSLIATPVAGNNPWFIATLFDAYFGFLWFWLWLAWREPGWIAPLLWLPAILLLGNIAMAAYVLLSLWRLPNGAGLEALLQSRRLRG